MVVGLLLNAACFSVYYDSPSFFKHPRLQGRGLWRVHTTCLIPKAILRCGLVRIFLVEVFSFLGLGFLLFFLFSLLFSFFVSFPFLSFFFSTSPLHRLMLSLVHVPIRLRCHCCTLGRLMVFSCARARHWVGLYRAGEQREWVDG